MPPLRRGITMARRERGPVSTWIIDGNNLLHRDPRLRAILQQSGFDAARRFLEAELGRRRPGNPRFHVIYDGGGAGASGQSARVGRQVARRDRSADDEILRLARQHGGGPHPPKVVTSDLHDIARHLGDLSVDWVSVEEFRRVLWDQRQQSSGARGGGNSSPGDASEKPRAPSGAEVDHWLQVFGENDDEGDDRE